MKNDENSTKNLREIEFFHQFLHICKIKNTLKGFWACSGFDHNRNTFLTRLQAQTVSKDAITQRLPTTPSKIYTLLSVEREFVIAKLQMRPRIFLQFRMTSNKERNVNRDGELNQMENLMHGREFYDCLRNAKRNY